MSEGRAPDHSKGREKDDGLRLKLKLHPHKVGGLLIQFDPVKDDLPDVVPRRRTTLDDVSRPIRG